MDMAKPDELALAEQIEELKEEREFARTLRNGIRLICDLKKGQTDVLFELFPWVKNEIASSPSATTDELLQRELERLEEMILKQAAPVDTPKIPPHVRPAGPKPLTVPQFALSPLMMPIWTRWFCKR
jgi:hypothetical protein